MPQVRKEALRGWLGRLRDECGSLAAALAKASPYSSLAGPSARGTPSKRSRAPAGDGGQGGGGGGGGGGSGGGGGGGGGGGSSVIPPPVEEGSATKKR